MPAGRDNTGNSKQVRKVDLVVPSVELRIGAGAALVNTSHK
jgi:hypothetical protein